MMKFVENQEHSAFAELNGACAKIRIKKDIKDSYLELQYDFAADGTEYVLFPGCCYNGNRFEVMKKKYPPMFTEEEARVDMPVTITDVPRLNRDGSGKIEVTTGDVSVPCVGVYSETTKKAVLVYTIQEIDGINLGLSYEKGKIGITYPHMRKKRIYRWPFLKEAKDPEMDFKKGRVIEIPYRVLEFSSESMEEFYQIYFENRKMMGLSDERAEVLPFESQFEIQKEKFNTRNWAEPAGYYAPGISSETGVPGSWRIGWCGGGMSSYALMKLGGKKEWERGMRTLEHIFRTQTEHGFFYEASDSFGSTGRSAKWHPVRSSSDALYYLFKHFELLKERGTAIPEHFRNGAGRLADAFAELWERYGQFGQFIDRDTGEIYVGGSGAGALVPAGLVKAYQFFRDKRYLETAKRSAEAYYASEARRGYTTGGPTEILQCPDSESAFALLESFVELYGETKDSKWLSYARHMANLCSSWVVAYNYRFPKWSEFGKKKMKTVGCVFANAQNKHAAPGICTMSGEGLYKLYKWTGDVLYLELLKDIAITISQYMSTEQRPIYSWDVPKDASLLNDDSLRAEPEKLPQGFICERVNMSDWESERCIGGVFNGSCWSETSNLLTLADVVPLLKAEK